MTAAGTETVEFKAVSLDGKAVAGGDFLLQLFDLAIFEFHDLPAARTDEVIVMALVGDVVVLRLRAEVSRLGDARITKEIQRAIDGGQSEMRIRLRELMIHGLGGDVLLPEKCGQDEFSLTGKFQLVFAEVLLEDIHLFREFADRHISTPPTGGH
jgi:hypothetical protein